MDLLNGRLLDWETLLLDAVEDSEEEVLGPRGVLWRYAIESESRLGPREKVVPLGSDGMTVDAEGMVVLTGRGVMVVDPVRCALVRTLLPDEGWCANVVAGVDGLYVTARTRLLRLSLPSSSPDPDLP